MDSRSGVLLRGRWLLLAFACVTAIYGRLEPLGDDFGLAFGIGLGIVGFAFMSIVYWNLARKSNPRARFEPAGEKTQARVNAMFDRRGQMDLAPKK